jgi:hypothetical protein
MRRILVVILFVFFPHWAAAQAPVVRAHLEPSGTVLVGQPVRLIVSIFVPNYFTGSPEFPEFELENAIVVLPQDRPENSNTQINGVSYAGITQTYVLYPQQAGDFRLPSAQMTVPYAAASSKPTIAHPFLPTLSFHARVPAAAKDLPYFLPTASLTITQRWSSPLKNLRTGTSLERTITVTASKMQSMLIPPLSLAQPEGIRIYAAQPITHDQKTDRGDFICGRRIESATYLIQKAGDYTLPPIELKWWNLSTQRLVTATLPEIRFTATTNPDYVAELPPPVEETGFAPVKKASLWVQYRSKLNLGLRLITIAFGFLLFAWLLRPTFARLGSWMRQRKTSEPAYFRDLIHAARANDARLTYVCLMKWSALVSSRAPLHEAMKDETHPSLANEVDSLSAALYSAHNSTLSTWQGARLAALLKQQRRECIKNNRRFAPQSVLTALNPRNSNARLN